METTTKALKSTKVISYKHRDCPLNVRQGSRITIITQDTILVCEVVSARDRTEPKTHLDHDPLPQIEIEVGTQEIKRGTPY